MVLLFSQKLFAQKFSGRKASQISVTHSESMQIQPETAISCNTGGMHYENSYYRNFDLYNDFFINGEWIVENIVIGAAMAKSETGVQRLYLKFYTMSESSPLVTDSLTLLYEQEAEYPDTHSDSLINYPVTEIVSVPARHNLVVEVLAPDGTQDGNYFFIASNALGETAPSYIRAPDCNRPEPVTLSSIGYSDMHVIMTVYGRYASPVPELLDFTVDGQITSTQIINEPDYTVQLIMPHDSALTELSPQVTVPAGFTSLPASGDTVDFSQGPVEYTVTNETGKISQSWMVSVENSTADILDFYVQGQIGESEISGEPEYTVKFTMPGDTSLNALAPDILVYDDFAVSPPAGAEQDFSQGPVTYEVRHRNSDYSREWTVYADQAVNRQSINEFSLQVYPNPVTNDLFIELPQYCNRNFSISLYTLSGKLIARKSTGNAQRFHFKLPDINRGVYLLKIVGTEGVYSRKIFVNFGN